MTAQGPAAKPGKGGRWTKAAVARFVTVTRTPKAD
jgi:hypothetical protein